MKRLEGRVLDLLALLEDDEAICEAINRGYVVSQGGITSTHKGRAALVTARAIKQWFDDGAKPPNPEPMRIEFYDPMWKRGRSAEVSTIEARVVALAQVDDEAFALELARRLNAMLAEPGGEAAIDVLLNLSAPVAPEFAATMQREPPGDRLGVFALIACLSGLPSHFAAVAGAREWDATEIPFKGFCLVGLKKPQPAPKPEEVPE